MTIMTASQARKQILIKEKFFVVFSKDIKGNTLINVNILKKSSNQELTVASWIEKTFPDRDFEVSVVFPNGKTAGNNAKLRNIRKEYSEIINVFMLVLDDSFEKKKEGLQEKFNNDVLLAIEQFVDSQEINKEIKELTNKALSECEDTSSLVKRILKSWNITKIDLETERKK